MHIKKVVNQPPFLNKVYEKVISTLISKWSPDHFELETTEHKTYISSLYMF